MDRMDAEYILKEGDSVIALSVPVWLLILVAVTLHSFFVRGEDGLVL